jgi:ribosomal protein S18 acetylase RimI-like enzyme
MQIGGVYTAPHLRRQGLSRALMRALIDDAIRLHGLTRLLLFTGENNDAALSLYDSLGFVRVGAFALCFGSLTDGDARDA